MGKCNHEEADTRILVHALQTKSIGLIHTGDIDIVVILLANHQEIISANPAADMWIYFHAGKSRRTINLNSIAANLDEETCKSLALFHTLKGSDSTSAFKFTGKRSCWNILTTCTLFPFIQEFAKNHRMMPNTVNTQVFVRLLPITSANCTELKLISTMLII